MQTYGNGYQPLKRVASPPLKRGITYASLNIGELVEKVGEYLGPFGKRLTDYGSIPEEKEDFIEWLNQVYDSVRIPNDVILSLEERAFSGVFIDGEEITLINREFYRERIREDDPEWYFTGEKKVFQRPITGDPWMCGWACDLDDSSRTHWLEARSGHGMQYGENAYLLKTPSATGVRLNVFSKASISSSGGLVNPVFAGSFLVGDSIDEEPITFEVTDLESGTKAEVKRGVSPLGYYFEEDTSWPNVWPHDHNFFDIRRRSSGYDIRIDVIDDNDGLVNRSPDFWAGSDGTLGKRHLHPSLGQEIGVDYSDLSSGQDATSVLGFPVIDPELMPTKNALVTISKIGTNKWFVKRFWHEYGDDNFENLTNFGSSDKWDPSTEYKSESFEIDGDIIGTHATPSGGSINIAAVALSDNIKSDFKKTIIPDLVTPSIDAEIVHVEDIKLREDANDDDKAIYSIYGDATPYPDKWFTANLRGWADKLYFNKIETEESGPLYGNSIPQSPKEWMELVDENSDLYGWVPPGEDLSYLEGDYSRGFTESFIYGNVDKTVNPDTGREYDGVQIVLSSLNNGYWQIKVENHGNTLLSSLASYNGWDTAEKRFSASRPELKNTEYIRGSKIFHRSELSDIDTIDVLLTPDTSPNDLSDFSKEREQSTLYWYDEFKQYGKAVSQKITIKLPGFKNIGFESSPSSSSTSSSGSLPSELPTLSGKVENYLNTEDSEAFGREWENTGSDKIFKQFIEQLDLSETGNYRELIKFQGESELINYDFLEGFEFFTRDTDFKENGGNQLLCGELGAGKDIHFFKNVNDGILTYDLIDAKGNMSLRLGLENLLKINFESNYSGQIVIDLDDADTFGLSQISIDSDNTFKSDTKDYNGGLITLKSSWDLPTFEHGFKTVDGRTCGQETGFCPHQAIPTFPTVCFSWENEEYYAIGQIEIPTFFYSYTKDPDKISSSIPRLKPDELNKVSQIFENGKEKFTYNVTYKRFAEEISIPTRKIGIE